ncbi:MAG: aspartate-semialdehyde dehydrogenase [Verrucomicrobia bacterium]|nr:MAG: aspartate-semialdehyde dehydrogenase [Verrucomicrobiota bacterium]
MKKYHVAIVGATGVVGQELLRVQQLDEDSFEKIDITFFSAGGEISRKYVPIACQADAIVIDNSSAFRMETHVPLVIPEINPEDVRRHRGLIANPNCTTAITLMALFPLHRAFGVRRIFAASYQAVSGSGTRAIDELTWETKRGVADQESLSMPGTSAFAEATADKVYPHPIAFNLLPHVDGFLETGYTKEEMKMQNEARKIMHLPQFCASVTCVRVPVYRAHSIAVSAEFERTVSLERAREVLAKAPGLELVDEPQNNRYPMPLSVTGKDDCEVGRVRLDCAFENGLSFWVSGDQLLKGAALNAVQIAELL